MDYKNKKIVVLGSTGFLGKNLRNMLIENGYLNVKEEIGEQVCNFILQNDAKAFYKEYHPEVVINCLGYVGGIGKNKDHPAEMIYNNLQMNLNAIHYAQVFGVEKFVQIGTVCSYPKFSDVPFKEDYLWYGFQQLKYDGNAWVISAYHYSNYPEETNAPYGLAKRILLPMIQAYRSQYNFNGIYVIPTNLYGPYDHFNTTDSHVIPALVIKVLEAKMNKIEKVIVWGSGRASRDFLYVEDACRGIMMALEGYEEDQPLNLGSGQETSIKRIVELICEKVGYDGEVVWDESKPDGQPRRYLDISKATEKIGFMPRVSIEKGVEKTIEWYLKNK